MGVVAHHERCSLFLGRRRETRAPRLLGHTGSRPAQRSRLRLVAHALCPVTNTMPIRRLGPLGRDVDDTHLVVAWVEVPSLRVLLSDQVYASASEAGGRRGRYTTYRRDFSALLCVDLTAW